jgi:hypothetical protein
MIDGLGGLKGILAVAGNLLINAFGDNIVKNIQRISDNFKLESDSIDTLRKDAADAVSGMYTDSTNSISGAARADVY